MHWRERQAKKIKKNQMNNILPPPKKEKILVFVFKGEIIYYLIFNSYKNSFTIFIIYYLICILSLRSDVIAVIKKSLNS